MQPDAWPLQEVLVSTALNKSEVNAWTWTCFCPGLRKTAAFQTTSCFFCNLLFGVPKLCYFCTQASNSGPLKLQSKSSNSCQQNALHSSPALSDNILPPSLFPYSLLARQAQPSSRRRLTLRMSSTLLAVTLCCSCCDRHSSHRSAEERSGPAPNSACTHAQVSELWP